MLQDEQKTNRHEYIGGSDVPIILGRSKFKTAWELLLEKAQLRTVEFSGNIYSHIGNVLEERIQDTMNIKNVDEITYKKEYDGVRFECHIDGIDKNEDLFYEIKVANQTLEDCYHSYEWQIRTYMYATGIRNARLVLLNRNKCSGGYLKKCTNYVLNFYQVDFIHDFGKIENSEQLIEDINVGLNNLVISKSDIETKDIMYDMEKEDYMLSKVKIFWDFKRRLEDNNDLENDSEFKNEFIREFNI